MVQDCRRSCSAQGGRHGDDEDEDAEDGEVVFAGDNDLDTLTSWFQII